MRRVHLVASGDVQGVFFRASARDRAADLRLTGWVRNTADGAVEVEVQGAPRDVATFIDFCRDGPGRSRVANLDVHDSEIVEDEARFEVRR